MINTTKNNSTPFSMKNLMGLLSVISVTLITGCNGNKGDLDDYFEEQRAKPAEPIDPIPEVKPYLRFAYPEHVIDPFDSSVLEPTATPDTAQVADNGITIDTLRVPEFLESFPLDSLRMVGTVERDKTRWALVRIPEGTVQTVKEGNYLGQNYGRIMDISDVKMSMIETVSNGLGGYEEREISITLNQE